MHRTIRALQLAQQRQDTGRDLRERAVRQRSGELAVEDRREVFPVLDVSNADAAIAYQEHACVFHARMLTERPNWRRDRADVEGLVKSYVAWRDTPEFRALLGKVVDRIVDTGEAVWHATAQVTGHPCSCAACAEVTRG